MLDPVDAYNRIAPEFARISEERRAYLEAIERMVVSALPAGSISLLDIGAGDGTRAFRIAQAAGIRNVVLLEPSAAMRASWPEATRGWPIRAEAMHAQKGQFSVITCLWNVLGHIFPEDARVEVLRQCGRLLAPGGRIFIDVSHRYNASHYGVWRTISRFVHRASKDVVVTWPGGITSLGHVFTAREFAGLCGAAGLTIERRWVVDYATGAIRPWSFQGHLLYMLRV